MHPKQIDVLSEVNEQIAKNENCRLGKEEESVEGTLVKSDERGMPYPNSKLHLKRNEERNGKHISAGEGGGVLPPAESK